MARQCKATNRAGKRCQRPPIPGGAVCRMHGGAAPQVQASAKERLAALVDPALTHLSGLLKQKADRRAQLGAVNSVLDRNGFKVADKHVIEFEGGREQALKEIQSVLAMWDVVTTPEEIAQRLGVH